MSFRVIRGELDVQMSEKDAKKMERATKKRPPKKAAIQLLCTEFDEQHKVAEVFNELQPYPEGRIFIGFPTHQTTGCSLHVAARVIPTVSLNLELFVRRMRADSIYVRAG